MKPTLVTLLSLLLTVTACKSFISGKADVRSNFQPTPGEERKARSLAEQSITSKNLKTDEHLYFINGELFRDKSEENKQMTNRFVLLTYYRYDGDVTIKALVDSTREKVVKVEAVPHIPTPLSQEEFGIAKNLALAEPTVQKALTSYGTNVVIEPLVVRSLSETERTQRLVRLLFKIGRDYLREPIVHVDLITKKVTVEKFESPSQPNH